MAESLNTTNLPVDDCALLMNFATKQRQKSAKIGSRDLVYL
jgi:hypothetical protein